MFFRVWASVVLSVTAKEMFEEIGKVICPVTTGSALDEMPSVICAFWACPSEAAGVAAARGTTSGALYVLPAVVPHGFVGDVKFGG